jgi:hypothetical protein
LLSVSPVSFSLHAWCLFISSSACLLTLRQASAKPLCLIFWLHFFPLPLLRGNFSGPSITYPDSIACGVKIET